MHNVANIHSNSSALAIHSAITTFIGLHFRLNCTGHVKLQLRQWAPWRVPNAEIGLKLTPFLLDVS